MLHLDIKTINDVTSSERKILFNTLEKNLKEAYDSKYRKEIKDEIDKKYRNELVIEIKKQLYDEVKETFRFGMVH